MRWVRLGLARKADGLPLAALVTFAHMDRTPEEEIASAIHSEPFGAESFLEWVVSVLAMVIALPVSIMALNVVIWREQTFLAALDLRYLPFGFKVAFLAVSVPAFALSIIRWLMAFNPGDRNRTLIFALALLGLLTG